MPLLPVALLPQVPMGKEGLVRAPRWVSLLPPFHTGIFAKQGKYIYSSSFCDMSANREQLLAQHWPGQGRNFDPVSGP